MGTTWGVSEALVASAQGRGRARQRMAPSEHRCDGPQVCELRIGSANLRLAFPPMLRPGFASQPSHAARDRRMSGPQAPRALCIPPVETGVQESRPRRRTRKGVPRWSATHAISVGHLPDPDSHRQRAPGKVSRAGRPAEGPKSGALVARGRLVLGSGQRRRAMGCPRAVGSGPRPSTVASRSRGAVPAMLARPEPWASTLEVMG